MNRAARAGVELRRGEDSALTDAQTDMSWSAVDDTIQSVIGAISGLSTSAVRVAIFAHNAAEVLLTHVGATLAGIPVVHVNHHSTVDELRFVLRDSGANVLMVGPETVGRAIEATKHQPVEHLIGWRTGHSAVQPWSGFLGMAIQRSADPATPAAPAIIYTSGTTGRPKGVHIPSSRPFDDATVGDVIALLHNGRFANYESHLVVGPMYHTGPLAGARSILAGVRQVILDRFDPVATLAAIDVHQIQTSVMVPTHFIRMLRVDPKVRARFSGRSLRYVVHTGAPCPLDVKRRMIEWWGPLLAESYGATEVGTTCSITSDEWLAHEGSVGRTVRPFTPLVVDANGAEVPIGTIGRLFFVDASGRGIVYPGDPEKSAAAHLQPGVFTIGEHGYVDEDGYVYITGREADLILSGGVNIYPAEVEAALLEHPSVADAVVFGEVDDEMGESVVASVVPAAGVDTDDLATDLAAWCRSKIGGYKCPRHIEIVTSLPRTELGKIRRRLLRRATAPILHPDSGSSPQ